MNLRAFRLLYQTWWRGKPVKPPYSHIVQVGDPVLRQPANLVDLEKINSDFMKQVYRRMRLLMNKTGACGLCAAQVGVPLRVFAIHVPSMKEFESPAIYRHRQMHPVPFQIWVNPEMKVLNYDKVIFDEGCESIKGFAADVPRYKTVMLTGLDEEGVPKQWEADGWSARIVQHEMDHLDGRLYVDIMQPKSLSCTCWNVVNSKEGRVYITYIPGK
ncbi:hypothetical protein AAG570_006651 [Ranatra chinensis]|uniref:Peptide deformylase n=1 Tax=Ranatra chinensis TaxID=642074 RepID=A0ABD0ZFW9_9HEMI